MEWLSGFLQKLNKPIHYLMVGVAIYAFAPKDSKWIGLVVVAFGCAGCIEWLWKQLQMVVVRHRNAKNIEAVIEHLNQLELAAIRPHIQLNEQTFYLRWEDYHGINSTMTSSHEYTRLFGVYEGLARKGLLALTTNDTIAIMTFLEPEWSKRKLRFANDMPDSSISEN
jgi:hypothetical protein